VGSITGLYTVLVEGDDLAEPVSDISRATLDGHIILSRDLADRGHYPAIDVLTSISRVMRQVVPPEQVRLAARLREHMAAYREMEDLINIGAYQRGTNPRVDAAIDRMDGIVTFLKQDMEEGSVFEEAFESLRKVLVEPIPSQPSQSKEPPHPQRPHQGEIPRDSGPPPVLPPGAYEF
jgi:flagellar biosynthesis/type III secretory pathway ATPase